MSRPLRVALLGQKFMGRAHSNAWRQAGRFFDLPLEPQLELVCARNADELEPFRERWGWARSSTRWQEVVEDPAVDLVDVATPNDVHAEQAIAALEAGKHVACEKPLAGTLDEARAMAQAAKRAGKGRGGAKTFVWFNYRRCPAVAFARELVRSGKLGQLYHVRAHYLQSWGGPDVPLLWRFKKKRAGSGAHGDLNAHIVDMARFVTGDEIAEVHGAVARTFVKQRDLPEDVAAGRKKPRKGRSDVDDCVLFNASFKGGAVASFECSRLAPGHLNDNTLEVSGEHGAVRFSFEDMNVLHYYDASVDAGTEGWRRIVCTSGEHHPYAAAWWPDAHLIGYEHGFTNMVADIVKVLGGRKPEAPLPDFQDAYETQRVLEAALVSARERASVKLSAIK